MIKKSSPILIFPAAHYQLDLFDAARDLGLQIATFDSAEDNPGHALADISQIIDVRDTSAALQFARTHGVQTACSVCSDISLLALAHITQDMGFPGPSLDLVETTTSKINFRRWQRRTGHRHPQFSALSSPRLGQDVYDQLPDAVVIKPDIASGSKGIYICTRDEITEDMLASSAGHSLNGQILIEERMPGAHYTFEGFLEKGVFAFAMFTSRLRNPRDGIGTIGHVFPSDLPDHVQQNILQDIASVFLPFGYIDGPVDCDLIIKDEQALILEITPRLGGNALSRLAKASFDISLPEKYLRHQLGLDNAWPDLQSGSPAAVCLITSDKAGRMEYDRDKLKQDCLPPWVTQITLDAAPGTPARPFRDGRDRLGEAVLLADTADMAQERLAEVLQLIDFRIDPS